jgi:hypothetical protein
MANPNGFSPRVLHLYGQFAPGNASLYPVFPTNRGWHSLSGEITHYENFDGQEKRAARRHTAAICRLRDEFSAGRCRQRPAAAANRTDAAFAGAGLYLARGRVGLA